MARSILILLFLIISIPVVAQVNIQFIPELQGRNLDGLLNVRILNLSGSKSVTLDLTVTERKSGKILSVRTEPFVLQNGNNSLPVSSIRSAKIQFSENRVSVAVKNNGYFPEGDYEYCFTVKPGSSNNLSEPFEQCFSYELVPTAPMVLIEPNNQDKICEKRPLLSWQPSFPQIPGASYQLILAEIKERQNATEALNYNLPIIIQSGVNSTILPFPPSAKELVPGKRYAWQVTAHKSQTILNRSEVWEFTVDCEDTLENDVVADEGYRDIEDLLRGNYLVVNGALRFTFTNSYEVRALRYTISCLSDPDLRIRRLPSRMLEKGRNKIRIDLQNNRSFVDGYSYLLTISLPDGSSKSLRFLYKNHIWYAK